MPEPDEESVEDKLKRINPLLLKVSANVSLYAAGLVADLSIMRQLQAIMVPC